MARRKSGFDNGSYIGLGIAGVAAYWVYSNWGTINATLNNALSSVSSALTPAAPITNTAGGILSVPATAAQVSNLIAQAQIAQQQATDAAAAGNPNASVLQAQASQLATAAAVAQLNSTTSPVGMQGLNKRYYRRRIA